MAENIGHLVIVESSTDGGAYTEIDGNETWANNRQRDQIEVTALKDATGAKIRIPGLRMGGADLGGSVVFASGTLALDTGIKNVFQRARDGGDLYLRSKVDGAAGTYRGAVGLVEQFSLSADPGGAVKWSAKTCHNGAGWQ